MSPLSTARTPGASIEHVNELPPDAARLRVILAWLDKQITDNATVGTYLQLQRDAVARALKDTEDTRQPRRPRKQPPRSRPGRLNAFPGSRDHIGFKTVERSGEGAAVFVSLHLGDCDLDDGPSRRLDAHDAYVALSDGLAACIVCRPDEVLGFG
jgi:hypothetical protein